MPWHRVVINYVDLTAGNLARAALMEKFGAVYRKAGVPRDVEVFLKSNEGKHVYYFSPEASALANDLLIAFFSEICADKPELSGFRKIPL
jgi:hypothetical protein